ncbi:unnamed protein product [Chondrus crispus]|uniref:Uncharacterized protein n=1 Tax=Chondrus crispus TaxID=2769 RepID=R7QAA6_CHOCR|nr:unnamed protein product [Chondrus crispus]CDF34400.1 unnamed protein product [Chondrus crispus]|eukprot:XP_005714219.1 unnamed protein product [Chondrus crispus]
MTPAQNHPLLPAVHHHRSSRRGPVHLRLARVPSSRHRPSPARAFRRHPLFARRLPRVPLVVRHRRLRPGRPCALPQGLHQGPRPRRRRARRCRGLRRRLRLRPPQGRRRLRHRPRRHHALLPRGRESIPHGAHASAPRPRLQDRAARSPRDPPAFPPSAPTPARRARHTHARVVVNGSTLLACAVPSGDRVRVLDVHVPPELLLAKPPLNTMAVEYDPASRAAYWLKSVDVVLCILPLPPIADDAWRFTPHVPDMTPPRLWACWQELGNESWRMGAGEWELEDGSWRMGAGG